jgi:hypothetical protein
MLANVTEIKKEMNILIEEPAGNSGKLMVLLSEVNERSRRKEMSVDELRKTVESSLQIVLGNNCGLKHLVRGLKKILESINRSV